VRLRIDTSGGVLECDVTLPANTSATLDLPLATVDGLTESGLPAGQAPGVSIVPGTTTLRLESGSYQFQWAGKN
jgi:alpha-L-rhamnosidase